MLPSRASVTHFKLWSAAYFSTEEFSLIYSMGMFYLRCHSTCSLKEAFPGQLGSECFQLLLCMCIKLLRIHLKGLAYIKASQQSHDIALITKDEESLRRQSKSAAAEVGIKAVLASPLHPLIQG